MIERRQTPERRRIDRPQPDRRKPYLTLAAWARAYGVDRHTVYKWLAAGVLETYTFHGVRRLRNLPPDQHQPEARP